jgi:hypothetical protein
VWVPFYLIKDMDWVCLFEMGLSESVWVLAYIVS